MKRSHKRVLDALKLGGRLQSAGTIHGTYNCLPKNSRWPSTGFQVHCDTIDEMRKLGLLVLVGRYGTMTLVAASQLPAETPKENS